MPATDLAAAIRAREVSPVEVTDAVLERIASVDPAVNAFCTVTDEGARRAARAAEEAVMRGDELGPLHGVPYSLKDLTATKGVRTTMGSRLYEHLVPAEDAVLAERLGAAGGILVGKTNTPDHGCKGVTDNLLFGRTRNPWRLDRTPGGSSGGAAAAVAAGMAPLAEGSDFAGSIRIPASFCGLVGLKPSDGRIPVWPNPSLFHPVPFVSGPMARTVADAALMLDVMAGPDPRDPRSLPDTGERYLDAVSGEVSLAGRRVAWTPDLGFAPVDPEVRRICEDALAVFEGLGCHVEPDGTDFSDATDAYSLLNATLRAALVHEHVPARSDDLDPLMVWRAEHARTRSAADVGLAGLVQSSVYERVRAIFERCDLLVLPTTPTPAFSIDLTFQDEIGGVPIDSPFQTLPLTFMFNLSGHPAVSVPAGFTADGLPVGLQIVAPWRDDAAALRAARAFEQAAPWAHRWPESPPAPTS
jgi:Asp-tRNA(Asn)/Glu-tRNA(Gln) amidotransferase A subunit family amidase